MKRITGIDPTGSSFDRIALCTASAALPQVFEGGAGEYRDRGTAIHKFLDRVAQLRRDSFPLDAAVAAALAETDEQWRAACDQVDIEQLGDRTTLSTEVALAYNWKADSGRVLHPVAPRQYEIDPDCEVALTLDVAGVGDRHVAVGDYKGQFAWLPDPATSLQLGVGALVLARIHRARSASVEYLRVRSDGSISRWAAELDVFGLEAVADRVQAMMREVEQLRGAIGDGVVPNVTTGPWCQFCKARMHCPAKTQLVRSVLEAGTKLSLREPITPANVGNVYALLKRAKEGVAIVEKAIHAYEGDGDPSTPEQLSPTAIPVGPDPDGSMRYFGRFERPGREQLDGATTLRVLTARYGAEIATKACEVETSKTAIEEVVRANLGEGEKLGATKDAIIAEIRAAGGTQRAKTDKATEFTVAPDGTVKTRKRKAS